MKLYNSFDKYGYPTFKNIEVSSEFDYKFQFPDGWEWINIYANYLDAK